MLEINNLTIELPRRGRVLDHVNLTAFPGQVTAVVGRSGSGATTLLRCLAQALPAGAQGLGRLIWRGRDLSAHDTRGLLVVADWAITPVTVAVHLRSLTSKVLDTAQRLGLAEVLGQRLSQLPADLLARIHLASLALAPAAGLVLVDSVSTAATGDDRKAIASALRRRAEAGAVVLWADHDLDSVWEHADRLVELDDGLVHHDGSPEDWFPHRLPEPTLLALARTLGFPPEKCRDAAGAAEFFHRQGCRPAPLPTGREPRRGDAVPVASKALGLQGEDLALGGRECVGLVDRAGRSEPLARALARQLRGAALVTGHLPVEATPRRISRAWERHHALSDGSVLETAPSLRPDQPLISHGSGDLARLRTALAAGPECPLWLPHPQAGLDAHDARRLAADLRSGPPGPRLVTSRDVEFLVRACHRILVVEAGKVVAFGAPNAVAAILPDPPLVSQAVGSTRHVRLTEVLEAAP